MWITGFTRICQKEIAFFSDRYQRNEGKRTEWEETRRSLQGKSEITGTLHARDQIDKGQNGLWT